MKCLKKLPFEVYMQEARRASWRYLTCVIIFPFQSVRASAQHNIVKIKEQNVIEKFFLFSFLPESR